VEAARAYVPRDPSQGVLQPLVRAWWPTYVETMEAAGSSVPAFVQKAVDLIPLLRVVFRAELRPRDPVPVRPFLYTVSFMHCMSVSLAADGAGLGTMWGRQTAERMLREAGFRCIEIHELDHDPQNDYYVNRK